MNGTNNENNMVTALCNVYINSDLKLRLFKETFPSVYRVSDNWLIYFRGKYKKEAELFVKQLDTSNYVIIFEKLNDRSWGLSVNEMLKYSKYNYIYIYIEDHFLVESLVFFKEVIKNAINNNIDYFSYSFFNADIDYNTLELSYPDYSKHFAFFDLTEKNKEYFKQHNKYFFPFSLVSVVSKEYFLKLLKEEFFQNKMIPLFVQKIMWRLYLGYPRYRILLCKINKLLNVINLRLTLFTPASPLNMERSIYEIGGNALPLKIGIVNKEIFANYDDDNGAKNVSILKRGKYPKKLKFEGVTKPIAENKLKQYKISAGEIVYRQFYLKSSRQSSIYLKYIYMNEGRIRIQSSSEKYVVNKNEFIYIYANIPHTIEGLEDSIFSVKIIPDESWTIGDYY